MRVINLVLYAPCLLTGLHIYNKNHYNLYKIENHIYIYIYIYIYKFLEAWAINHHP